RKQAAAVAWVQSHDGIVRYKLELDPETKHYRIARGGTPAWLQHLLGEEHFESINEVWIESADLTDISPLADLPDLEELKLSHNQIRDLSPLSHLKKLKR